MAGKETPTPVVFTDLDGTFLDHCSYAYGDALPAVERLKAMSGKLYAVSSKTLAEQKDLFDGKGIFDGYVAENGGVIALGEDVVELGPCREKVALAKLAIEAKWGKPIPSFTPQFIDNVMRATGLARDQALLACERRCSDPLIFDEVTPSAADLAEFEALAKVECTRLVHGGRFATLCGHHGKADAMLWLLKHLTASGIEPVSLALGDSRNDLDMLKAAQTGVLIPNPDGFGVGPEDRQGLIQAPEPGPRGWCVSVTEWLLRIGA